MPNAPTAIALIEQAKRRQAFSPADLRWLINAYVRDEIPDYQIAAWLMAVCLNGLSAAETGALTEALVASGRRLDLRAAGLAAADKHSTGGIGDKTTLVVAPLIAAAGLPVAKMSGRGLGFTGGTLDKLEAIPGLRVDLSATSFVRQVQAVGLAIAGQTSDLAPGDGKLYALRDVTATVDSIPLIAASVMSKKIAAGASYVALDVKMGGGAFIAEPAAARTLAETMLAIGRDAGLRVVAALSRMDEPLGWAVGNALEVAEAVATLRDAGPPDLRELSLRLGAELLQVSGVATDVAEANRKLESALGSGAALAKLVAMVAAQGGDPRYVERPELLPSAPARLTVRAARSGFVDAIAARALGYAATALGAGRAQKGAAIDHAVGVVLHAKVGDAVASGAAVATVHGRTPAAAERAARAVEGAYSIADARPPSLPVVAEVLR